jgi:hypothetical protein
MIVVGKTYISDDIADKMFVCDLLACKGACCTEGDLGAPLEESELPILAEIYDKVKPFLMPEGIQAIEEQGWYVEDFEGDYSTPTIGNRECAYAIYDDKGILKCGIEQAYLAGQVEFRKPVSCHLYPIRITKYDDFHAVNYHRWQICNPACQHGEALKVPLYKFLKEPLVRQYGEEWYKQLTVLIEKK